MGKQHLLANETHPAEQPRVFAAGDLQVIPFIWRQDLDFPWLSCLNQDSSSLTFKLFNCREMNPTVGICYAGSSGHPSKLTNLITLYWEIFPIAMTVRITLNKIYSVLSTSILWEQAGKMNCVTDQLMDLAIVQGEEVGLLIDQHSGFGSAEVLEESFN